MSRPLYLKLVLLVLPVVLVLSACGVKVSPTPTPDILQTVVAQTVEAVTSLTPESASKTPQPTSTPTIQKSATVTPTPTNTATAVIVPTATPAQLAYGPTNFPNNVDPLTGQVVSDPTLLARRPMMIKVANYPREGRPHAGLSAADIVFDYYIGEGANRFLALYYGQNAPKSGPIRSGRYVDVQLVPMYQGILGFESAWAPILTKIFDTLGARAVYGTDNTCPAICDDGRHEVTSWFADIAQLAQYATKKGFNLDPRPNLDGMVFDPAKPQGGSNGQSVLVEFFSKNLSEWRYDATSGKYLAWIEQVDANDNPTLIPMLDRNTSQQVAFSNVIVMYATYDEMAPALHDIDIAKSFSVNKAVVFRDGVAVDAFWKSVGLEKPIQFFDANKKPLALKPGNSWIFIVGQASIMKQTDPGKWNVKFYLP
jgi:hypothetical protein